MKKGLTMVSLPFAAMIFMTACNNDEVQSPPPEQEMQEGTNQSTMNASNSTMNFTEFDLEVDYKGMNNEFDAEYEKEANEKIEAKMEDKQNDKKLEGDKAYEELAPKLEQLTFDQNTSDEDVMKEVLKTFDLKEDFQKFELEVTFNDGTKKEYKMDK
ncbi:YusW family protein [Bacillus sp. CGMCC 1.16541]|uniref:YusW family protein n=1 Tax=Bacillus sp. CGMCC 1.16541 TaxID=2185143 RepID=UPI0013A56090|nr:YusW family protein [Bacillus sp. CGMCC 1.16541]